MSALRYDHDNLALDSETLAALQRFEEDAQTFCAASTIPGAGSPRRVSARATAAYREALVASPGLPGDRRWELFIRTVAALLATPVIATSRPGAAAAAARLRRIVEENADLLPPDVNRER
jgi:hypothetical protein